MKTRRWLVLLFILALVAAYSYMGVDVLKQHRQTNNLVSETAGLTAVLGMLPEIPTDLDQRLAAAQARLTTAESAFAGETDDTKIVNSVLRLAVDAGVKGVPLSTQPWATVRVLERDFSVFHLSLQVTSDFQHLQNFLKLLDNGEIKTLSIEYLKVVRDSANSSANMTANLDVAVYALVPAAQ